MVWVLHGDRRYDTTIPRRDAHLAWCSSPNEFLRATMIVAASNG